MAKDLQSYIGMIEREYPHHLVRIKKEVDPLSHEVAAVLKHLTNENRHPIVLFEAVKNVARNRSAFPYVDNLYSTRQLCAIALGLAPDNCKLGLSVEFAKREAGSIEPLIVDRADAPVKDVVRVGDEVDVRELPAGRYHEMDVGPYLTMTDIMKADDGFYDVSFVKHLMNGAFCLQLANQCRRLRF